MIDFNLMNEAEKYAKESADEEIINLARLYDWNKKECKMANQIAQTLLSVGYFNGALKYKNKEKSND